jgi:uncharacterized RDD family membrane protein YckC
MARWRKIKNKTVQTEQTGDNKGNFKNNQTIDYTVFANFLSRVKAFITDMFMIMMPIAYIMTYLIMDGKDDFQGSQAARWAISVLYGMIVVYLWHKNGQTPGKKAYEIKVVDAKTLKAPSWSKSLLRYIMFLFSATSIIGLLFPLFRKDKKALHDILSGTCVINFPNLKKS